MGLGINLLDFFTFPPDYYVAGDESVWHRRKGAQWYNELNNE